MHTHLDLACRHTYSHEYIFCVESLKTFLQDALFQVVGPTSYLQLGSRGGGPGVGDKLLWRWVHL